MLAGSLPPCCEVFPGVAVLLWVKLGVFVCWGSELLTSVPSCVCCVFCLAQGGDVTWDSRKASEEQIPPQNSRAGVELPLWSKGKLLSLWSEGLVWSVVFNSPSSMSPT